MNNHTENSSKTKSTPMILIIGVLSICISIFAINYSKDKARQAKIEEKRSTKICQDLYKDAYEGIIIKAKKNHLRIRKLDDPKFKEFNYLFSVSYKVNDHFYKGQKVFKQAQSEFFSAELREGGRKEFSIPCWE